jgi:DNA repair protein RecN (Recombination protein N)
MLRRLALRDFVIVRELDLEFSAGFCVLTGETGAGKSILIDALQLVLGGRADAGLVREGAPRTEVSAEFDAAPVLAWLTEAGYDDGLDAAEPVLLLRRTLDAQGKSRAWINGSPATAAQLKVLAEALVDIHGQHAWQGLTRPAAVRQLLDGYAGLDTTPMTAAWSTWRAALAELDTARSRSADIEQERERLAWQLAELDKLGPAEHEWDELNAEHQRLAHAQSIIDAVQRAQQALAEAEPSATSLAAEAALALQGVADFDPALADAYAVLLTAQAQLSDAAHSLSAALRRTELDPERLGELDERLSSWVGLARRFRRQPAELPALLLQWREQLRALDAATDLDALLAAAEATRKRWLALAQQASAQRQRAAPRLSAVVTAAMQELGMAGGQFEVALLPLDEPQAHGLEQIELRVAGHAGTTPRPLAKVASGGELSRIALAIAVTTSAPDVTRPALAGRADAPRAAGEDAAETIAAAQAGTLIFDEVDAGIGGAVAHTVGRLMQRLGATRQVLAVTHLAQVAACADRHVVVSKASSGDGGGVISALQTVDGQARVAELARMLGGAQHSAVGLAHAQELLDDARRAAPPPAAGATGKSDGAKVLPTSANRAHRANTPPTGATQASLDLPAAPADELTPDSAHNA